MRYYAHVKPSKTLSSRKRSKANVSDLQRCFAEPDDWQWFTQSQTSAHTTSNLYNSHYQEHEVVTEGWCSCLLEYDTTDADTVTDVSVKLPVTIYRVQEYVTTQRHITQDTRIFAHRDVLYILVCIWQSVYFVTRTKLSSVTTSVL